MEKIVGFTIRQKGENFYAVKRIGSKIVWITLGKSLDNAETKINQYCGERGIEQNQPRRKSNKDQVRMLEEQISNLTNRVRMLEEQISNLTKSKRQQTPEAKQQNLDVVSMPIADGKERVLGFIIKKTARGHWVANRGKINVHVGMVKEDAENKIRAYCTRHGIELDK